MSIIIEVNQLSVHFPLSTATVKAVDGVDLAVEERETLAIIGESGSGKSVLGTAILGLFPPTCTVSGTITYEGKDLLCLSEEQLRSVRGLQIAWIPQNPASALNPSMRTGLQVGEPLSRQAGWTRERIHERVLELFAKFRVLPPEERSQAYPDSYSGGMLQRSLVAMGTSASPKVIIADEPTKGVDTLNKESIATAFREVRNQGITLVVITHDLDFARELADRVVVMYNGAVLEISDKERFFERPLHPYSAGLLRSLPENGLVPIPGRATARDGAFTSGCRFRSRCPGAGERCAEEPPLIRARHDDAVRCWNYD
ncbi:MULTISPECIES: ABC transporter ATP-binding protein [unclassified Methanoregula]|uniref:ABC transporter ATP-binding protein n=1 Tax=unclassified Methanoregula TaxID=2649730 RepID=UPI0025F07591|nr:MULTISPECIES: ABC transporter ATP-binding protein [unclassified Methanoregula]